jgi:hypothetical protein
MIRRTIWKLQRPLATNMPVLEVMAYTEGHENVSLIPMTDYEIKELFGDELKVYVSGRVINGILHVKKRVKERDW